MNCRIGSHFCPRYHHHSPRSRHSTPNSPSEKLKNTSSKMSLRPSTAAAIQDMPPPGGYKKLDFTRYLPDRGPKGWQLWAGATTLIMYGYYQVGKTNQARIQQKMQERKVRYALAPLMQAEADREYMERELVNLRREAEIMKDVTDLKGNPWVPGSSQYFGGQWMPRKVSYFMRHQG
eukprot:scaffold11114_cov135-Skeletonema_dohrnii-CCMP3373.AAC.2